MGEETNYEILMPNNAVENKAEDAFDFALRKEEIKNIAITGQYSSGKSSLIQSYFDKYIDKKDYLNISLATFEKTEKEEDIIEESNSLEKIIIEKLYYSILEKYNTQENIKGAILSGIFVAFINIAIYLFNTEAINNSLNNSFWTTVIFIVLEIICLTSVIGCSISYLMKLQKIKLKLGDIEVEINQDTKKEKSRNLLNDEIEFIVKILNIAKYKYIIFEDLDRFQNPKIFERLRDLNITLNSTLKQKIKFIYAIKDEMFIADSRTKFFDFIIPVVPYVSYENSGEELLKIIKKYGLENELSEDFILDISLYISDMRILKNTVNEYIVYKKTLGKNPPNYEKLFAILLYKNTCSQDFAKLQKNDGEVFKCFKDKNKKIDEYIVQKENQILEKEKEYKELEKYLISKNQFEKLAIYMIKSNINNSNQITLQNSKGNTKTIQYRMNTENLLENFISDEETTIEYVYNNNWKTEKLIDFYKSNCPGFIKQCQDFKDGIDAKKENINLDIKKLKEEIDKTREYTLSELIQENKESITVKLGTYNNLVKYLLSNGYIDENYSTYINKFHEGSITEKDYIFIMNVRNGKKNDYKEKLDNCFKIAKRLKNIDLKREESLNIYILDTLLENQEYSEKRIINLGILIKSNRYIEILTYCICESKEFKNKNMLITNLCSLDKTLLKNIKESKIEKRYRDLLLEFIIERMDLNILNKLEYIDEIMIYVQENNLLSNSKLNTIKNKIREFNIKYYNISNFKSNIELYKYIIDNNMYMINFENILEILMDDDKSNDVIEYANYDCISNNKQLKQYIDDNIQYYIDKVYNELRNKQKNSISAIKELLNNSNISFEGKQVVIIKETSKIDNILEIEDYNLWSNIFENNLINLDWNNINNYYEKFGLDETLYKIFNNYEKRKIVLKDTIKIEDNSSCNFVIDLLLSNNLNEDAYDDVLKKSECKLQNNALSELKQNRLLKLINSKKIETNINMIDNIRNYSIEILLVFIKNNYSVFHREIDNGNIVFNLSEINEILKSDVTSTIKGKCFNMISDEELENVTLELLENIALVSIENNFREKISEKMLLKLVSNIKNIETKIKLINQNFSRITRENIMNYLVKLGENYSKIITDRTKPKFVNNESNKALLENIKSLGYNIKYSNNAEDKNIVLSNTIR